MKASWWVVCAGLAGALLVATGSVSAQKDEMPKDAAATISDDVISMAELEQSAATELAGLEQQRHRLLDQKLAQLIADRLLAREAKKRGVTVDALLREEVSAKVPPVAEADVAAFMAQNRGRMPRGNEAQLKARGEFPHPFFWAAFQLTGRSD